MKVKYIRAVLWVTGAVNVISAAWDTYNGDLAVSIIPLVGVLIAGGTLWITRGLE